MHLILCDKINSGKSTFMMGLVQRLITGGAKISGWVTPPHIKDGKKAGHDFVLFKNGEIAPPIPFTREEPFENSFQWARFHFNKIAFEQAAKLSTNSDLFIMDEIGPLELIDNKGFADTACAALTQCPNTLTIVRCEMKEKFIEFANLTDIQCFTLANKAQLEILFSTPPS